MAFSRTIIMLGCLSLSIAPLAQSATGDSETSVASTPAPPACNAPLPDEDTVSRYRSLAATDKGRRLIEAAKEGAASEVRALLAAGADVAAREDEDSTTALHGAAAEGHADVASCLLASGAEVDARALMEATPLHAAAYEGHTPVVRLLVAAGADPNARLETGDTPLHLAAAEDHAEAAAALLEAGADKGLRDYKGETPLDVADNQQLRLLLAEG